MHNFKFFRHETEIAALMERVQQLEAKVDIKNEQIAILKAEKSAVSGNLESKVKELESSVESKTKELEGAQQR
jgi:hypothetical protein